MMTIVSNEKLRQYMSCDDLYQFQESVLKRNINVMYPDASDITIHAHDDGRLMAIVLRSEDILDKECLICDNYIDNICKGEPDRGRTHIDVENMCKNFKGVKIWETE